MSRFTSSKLSFLNIPVDSMLTESLNNSYKESSYLADLYKLIKDKDGQIHREDLVQDFVSNLSEWYLNPCTGFFKNDQSKINHEFYNNMDVADVRFRSINSGWQDKVYIEAKAKNGESWMDGISQARRYATLNKADMFIVSMKHRRIAFFVYNHNSALLRETFDIRIPYMQDIVCIYPTDKGIGVFPCTNDYCLPFISFDPFSDDPRDEYAIHTIFSYMATCESCPIIGTLGDRHGKISIEAITKSPTLCLLEAEVNTRNKQSILGLLKEESNNKGKQTMEINSISNSKSSLIIDHKGFFIKQPVDILKNI